MVKIELNIIIFLLIKMTLPLVNHNYVVITKTWIDNTYHVEKYTGTCYGAFIGGDDWVFCDVARVKTPYDIKRSKTFSRWDEYLELSQMNKLIKKARSARDNMEKRALNIILKRLINEEFQW
jgi:hypothetical protein